ncbi:PREDICTED: probable E3 ubiquitin-protein ligase HERC4 [Ceratosolen solmsi marchali]|uniref:Probable E3 ubiquitin-protein ligase HERC4 n=1 Tax=Ceratosolen solmsi marchali TaxID=326594 RepID=A0AAJ7E2L1_9HYME|nr:PREDICTED: probable E3 ubiquitin-protein ligase HERC4 [Ceratosolen solmsi marchali]
MYCWGSTVHGELGLGGIEDENILLPRELDFQKALQVKQIACGENHTIIITEDGQIYSCGNNDSGQLGHEKPTKRLQLLPGLDAFTFKQAACGGSHSVAVNNWGQLFCWGNNSVGQLGLDTSLAIVQMPRMVKSLATNIVVQIACGQKHSLALTNNGELYSWGSNSNGQLGHGQQLTMQAKPKLITGLIAVPIAFIACGGYHSIVVSKSGAVFGWGKNTFGQLGMNDFTDKYVPYLLKTLRNARVKYVACGEEFTVFLTMDGGVFTCGAGMYGQLGHGANSNEILPRQIIELMGSVVTQISCGKRHTLALVPLHRKIYAWGIGGSGQLGNKTARSVTTPQVVLGPWISKNDPTAMEVDSQNFAPEMHVIKHIFSGGDQCFAIVRHREDNIESDDCRIYLPITQILTINEEQLIACQRISQNSSVDHDLMMYIETVFKSQACINASFLLTNNAHYNCSYRQHGVDLEVATRVFGLISEIVNTTISELIWTCITEVLLPSLITSPRDIECLRIYLILPLYHGFTNPDNCTVLHKPFSMALFSLNQEEMRTLESWWTKAPKYYFERFIRIYKSIVVYFIKQPNVKETKIVSWNSTLQSALDTLKFLNKLNNANDRKQVPHNIFYLRELTEYIDVRGDYCQWQFNKNSHHKIIFCNYPFLFDAEAKTILLETDQALQMQSAMNEAASRTLTHVLFSTFHENNPGIGHYHQLVTLTVSRENIVADTLRELADYSSDDLKKPLRVKFHGEEAEDVGGVKKEFFMLLLKEILDPKYGMFKEFEQTRTIWFSEDSFEDEVMYFLIGLLCGLAIYNFIIIELPFPLALYKKLLNESVGLTDIKSMSPVLARSLQNILDYEEENLEATFALNFEVSRQVFGEEKVYELIPNGSKIPVTMNNKKQFVELYVDYILNKSVDSHFKAFYKGFHKVCGGRVLELFHSDELMAVVIGNEEYDWQKLEQNAIYKEGYTKEDPTVILFWKVFHELSLEQKKKFLLFLTGSDRIPLQGMKAIKIAIQPMSDDKMLPVAHTCFNLLDLPRYQTRDRLRHKLLQAIQQTQGFSLV